MSLIEDTELVDSHSFDRFVSDHKQIRESLAGLVFPGMETTHCSFEEICGHLLVMGYNSAGRMSLLSSTSINSPAVALWAHLIYVTIGVLDARGSLGYVSMYADFQLFSFAIFQGCFDLEATLALAQLRSLIVQISPVEVRSVSDRSAQ